MNNTYKSVKHHFNIIDFVILIAICVIVFFSIKLFINEFFGNEYLNVSYVIEITGVEKKDFEKLKVNDNIYLENSNFTIGRIKNVSAIAQEYVYFNNITKKFNKKSNENLFTLNILVEASCENKNGVLVIEDKKLLKNIALDIATPFSYEKAEIVEINPQIAPEENAK